MQDVPCATVIVSAGRHYAPQSSTKSAELPSVPLLRAVSQSHEHLSGFRVPIDGFLYKYSS